MKKATILLWVIPILTLMIIGNLFKMPEAYAYPSNKEECDKAGGTWVTSGSSGFCFIKLPPMSDPPSVKGVVKIRLICAPGQECPWNFVTFQVPPGKKVTYKDVDFAIQQAVEDWNSTRPSREKLRAKPKPDIPLTWVAINEKGLQK